MSTISMFTDKVYEEMDDISKLVEPIESEVNNELSQMPDEIEITPSILLSQYDPRYGWNSLSVRAMIQEKALELKLTHLVEEYGLCEKFYKFEVRDLEEGEDVIINFETDYVSHKIFLVKYNLGYTEQELEEQIKNKITRQIRGQLWSNRVVNKPRLNELADLFGAEAVKTDRSYKGKVRKFCQHLGTLVDDRKLDIKDITLCSKFGKWIILYVRDGNLAALNNITRIKIMMHENRPIYSIEEREV